MRHEEGVAGLSPGAIRPSPSQVHRKVHAPPIDLELFIAIAETGSLTAAARASGLTRTTLARHLASLEESLGVVLVNRSTRDFSLTEAGHVYLRGCRDTLARFRQAEADVRELDGSPRGQLRIACPILLVDQIIGPLVTSFIEAYPEVDVQVRLTSETINPLVDGFDAAVQIGFETHSSLITRCLLREKYTLVASPAYLARRGGPQSARELADHDCLVAVRANGMREPWPLVDGGEFAPARPRLLANASALLRFAAAHGAGIALMAHSIAAEDLASGALVRVLEGSVGQLTPVSLVYASGSRLSPKLRCFVDFTQSWVERAGALGARVPGAADAGPPVSSITPLRGGTPAAPVYGAVASS